MNPTVRLSCEQCRRRKTRCDKGAPCSACKNAGLDCNVIQRTRLPRGRSSKVQKQSSALESRLTHIEDLVKQLESQARAGNDDKDFKTKENAKVSNAKIQSDVKNGSFLVQDFWTMLSQEVSGLRDILQESEDEDISQEPYFTTPHSTSSSSSTSGTILFNQIPISNDLNVSQPPSSQMRKTLLNLYYDRVDTLFKAVHFSTVNDVIESKYSGASNVPQSPALLALEWSIYFAALCSITNDESENLLLEKKQALIQQYQSATEIYISRAGLLTSPSLVLLQAFVLYLSALRSSISYAPSWTLLAIATRVASALGLGSEDPKNFSTYELEIRRRLWFCIGVLDTQTALDRGSVPLLPSTDFMFPPLNINDVDMRPALVVVLPEQGFTDMSFSLVTYEAMVCQKKLCMPAVGLENNWDVWKYKIQVLADFEKSMTRQYYGINESSKPLEKFTKIVAQGAVANLQLLLRRPLKLYKYDKVPVWDDFKVMETAVKVLEKSLEKQAFYEFSRWAWWAWVKWYALAVVLAELCSNRQALFDDRAYLVAQQSYAQYSQLIADTSSGILWKPISRLMHQVEYLRNHIVEQSTAVEPLYQSNAHISSSSGIRERSVQQLSQNMGHSFDYGAQVSQSIQHTNIENDGWNLEKDTYGIFTTNESLDLTGELENKDGMHWLNWDDFLEDMNRSSDIL